MGNYLKKYKEAKKEEEEAKNEEEAVKVFNNALYGQDTAPTEEEAVAVFKNALASKQGFRSRRKEAFSSPGVIVATIIVIIVSLLFAIGALIFIKSGCLSRLIGRGMYY
jgi:t-SNARE complex subunit (syntaxin)